MTWGIKTTRCLLRRVIYVAMRVCYRLSVHGQEHVPKRGAALVVCNHASLLKTPLALWTRWCWAVEALGRYGL